MDAISSPVNTPECEQDNGKSGLASAMNPKWLRAGAQTSASVNFTRISLPYLLVSNIPCYRDKNGRRHLDRLWHRDLIEHCNRLSDFTLASPREDREAGEDTAFLDHDPALTGLKLLDLPSPQSFLQAIAALGSTAPKLLKAVRASRIVHSGIAGWPIPYGWLLTPMCNWSKKFHIVVVESAPWRLHQGMRQSLRAFIRSVVFEYMAARCVSSADLAIFTHDQYRRTIYRGKGPVEVIPASWIGEETVLPVAQALVAWKSKCNPAQRMKMLFAGRLTEAKGVKVLLSAMDLLAQRNITLQLDILGNGELLALCRQAAVLHQGTTRINLLGTVDYGRPFFELLRQYHAAIVPSLSDEQPRIVYDAYSQAVPVLASRTPGLSECVRTTPAEQQSGELFTPNDAEALAETLEDATRDVVRLREMGMHGRELAETMTHQAMHERRNALIDELLILRSIEQPPRGIR